MGSQNKVRGDLAEQRVSQTCLLRNQGCGSISTQQDFRAFNTEDLVGPLPTCSFKMFILKILTFMVHLGGSVS